jgi:phosphate/sulfate permease
MVRDAVRYVISYHTFFHTPESDLSLLFLCSPLPDVANSFASTVASKSLTLKQAVIVAGVFEFCGALFLGAAVTSTIRNKIFDPELYEGQEDIVLLGMFTSLMSATIMLLVATHFGLPVSTTHTVVGCIMGFSIAAKGFSSINWDVAKKIWISWIVSPLVTGVIAFLFFIILRVFVLHHDNAFKRAYLAFPFVLLVGIGIDLFYILYKGMNNLAFAENLTLEIVVPVSFGVGGRKCSCPCVTRFVISMIRELTHVTEF